MIYCVIPRELEDELFAKMVEYYAGNPNVTVIVDRRHGPDRRQGQEDGSYRERRVVRDRLERPVEYIRVLYRPDLYHFEMSMRRVREESGPRWTATTAPTVPADGG